MFWNLDAVHSDAPAVYDDAEGILVSYGALKECGDRVARLWGGKKRLIFLFTDGSYRAIAYYLAALREGHAVFLADPQARTDLAARWIELYSPDWLIGPSSLEVDPARYVLRVDEGAYRVYSAKRFDERSPDQDLALLLPTSGTTGSPKLVRLSGKSLQANAESIKIYLNLTPQEKAITTLPMQYSYGLSVINSHLAAGASLVATGKPVTVRDFWLLAERQSCTSLAGVPYTYQVLERIGFFSMTLPALKTLTQAGGRLSREKILFFCENARRTNRRFFVMYGQTEATARISYVPFDRLPEKAGAIGTAIPGGRLRLEIEGKEIVDTGVEGELVYEGPNVMMGYAENRNDLTAPDEMKGVLHTGDLATRDKDGFYFLTGRLNRYVKLAYGMRVNLDDVERHLEAWSGAPVAVFENNEKIAVVIESSSASAASDVMQHLRDYYRLDPGSVSVRSVDRIPVTSSNKTDYAGLKSAC